MRQAKLGVEAARPAIVDVLAGDVRYWLAPERTPASVRAPRALLLPTYDEFLIAYKDRELAAPVSEARSGVGSYAQHLMIDGRLAGSWRRTLSARGLHLDVRTYAAPTREDRQSIEAVVGRYGSYMGLTSTVAIES